MTQFSDGRRLYPSVAGLPTIRERVLGLRSSSSGCGSRWGSRVCHRGLGHSFLKCRVREVGPTDHRGGRHPDNSINSSNPID